MPTIFIFHILAHLFGGLLTKAIVHSCLSGQVFLNVAIVHWRKLTAVLATSSCGVAVIAWKASWLLLINLNYFFHLNIDYFVSQRFEYSMLLYVAVKMQCFK